jgi:hypothetical protein
VLAGVPVGAGTVGLAVGIEGAGPVLVVVTGALLIDPASAPTDGELAKLLPLCLAGAGGFIE